jgi:hypothetical protein
MLTLNSPTALAADDHGELKHHAIGLIIANADERSGGDHLTLGLEYEYRSDENIGAGLVYEKTENAHHGDGVSIGLAALYYYPYAGWRLGAGLGREKVHGSRGGYNTLYRAGIAYDFHVGRFGIAPMVDYDWIEGESNVLVYGVVFMLPF